MWRITGVFVFMCGVLALHLAQQDWSVATRLLPVQATQTASVITATDQSETTAKPTVTTIDEHIATMTIEEKVGQLFMVGHWKQDYYQHTARLVDLYHLGGIIIMEVDDSVVTTVPEWTAAWQDVSKYPLLISVDQEGGVVSRIRAEGYLQTPQREMVNTRQAFDVGYARGQELQSLGINTNLAPVLDYASTSDAFLYDRSFATSSTLSELAVSLIAGHHTAGTLAIPKHFPGHANTPADSHFELPVVDITAAEFPSYTQQFRAVLQQESVGALMTAHVLFPKLDAIYPTTLSEEILSRQLRRELGFDGVIITDDMTMGAITNQWTTNEATVRAIQAGADMILFAAEPNAAIEAHRHVLQAIDSGEITTSRIDESVRRILQLKQDESLLE